MKNKLIKWLGGYTRIEYLSVGGFEVEAQALRKTAASYKDKFIYDVFTKL